MDKRRSGDVRTLVGYLILCVALAVALYRQTSVITELHATQQEVVEQSHSNCFAISQLSLWVQRLSVAELGHYSVAHDRYTHDRYQADIDYLEKLNGIQSASECSKLTK